MFKVLKREFYLRNTILVAKELLGKIIVKKNGRQLLSGKIVETEAYIGNHDPACHAYQNITGRSAMLYEKGGTIYVYFIYGNYYCFNLVTEKEGNGCAVLIRAVEPISGINIMKINRNKISKIIDLTNGPSKFCMAFGIGRNHNGLDATSSAIKVFEPVIKEKFDIITTKRIGISSGIELPYRYYIKNNPFVTKHKFNF